MKTLIMASNPQDSFSFSSRRWKKKVVQEYYHDEEEGGILNLFNRSSSTSSSSDKEAILLLMQSSSVLVPTSPKAPRKKRSVVVSKLRSALSFGRARTHSSSGLGTKVVGTLFGHRRGHVHFAFQEDYKLAPAFIVELATPTSILVTEMASGLVRIALECDKKKIEKKNPKLLEEPIWRTYCNGKKCGYALMKRECGPEEWKVLNAIGPVSMGAGVLPSGAGDGKDEMMYMRAKFERVVGSKDSEAFYMMNIPDHGNTTNGGGGPELSIYLLRL